MREFLLGHDRELGDYFKETRDALKQEYQSDNHRHAAAIRRLRSFSLALQVYRVLSIDEKVANSISIQDLRNNISNCLETPAVTGNIDQQESLLKSFFEAIKKDIGEQHFNFVCEIEATIIAPLVAQDYRGKSGIKFTDKQKQVTLTETPILTLSARKLYEYLSINFADEQPIWFTLIKNPVLREFCNKISSTLVNLAKQCPRNEEQIDFVLKKLNSDSLDASQRFVRDFLMLPGSALFRKLPGLASTRTVTANFTEKKVNPHPDSTVVLTGIPIPYEIRGSSEPELSKCREERIRLGKNNARDLFDFCKHAAGKRLQAVAKPEDKKRTQTTVVIHAANFLSGNLFDCFNPSASNNSRLSSEREMVLDDIEGNVSDNSVDIQGVNHRFKFKLLKTSFAINGWRPFLNSQAIQRFDNGVFSFCALVRDWVDDDIFGIPLGMRNKFKDLIPTNKEDFRKFNISALRDVVGAILKNTNSHNNKQFKLFSELIIVFLDTYRRGPKANDDLNFPLFLNSIISFVVEMFGGFLVYNCKSSCDRAVEATMYHIAFAKTVTEHGVFEYHNPSSDNYHHFLNNYSAVINTSFGPMSAELNSVPGSYGNNDIPDPMIYLSRTSKYSRCLKMGICLALTILSPLLFVPSVGYFLYSLSKGDGRGVKFSFGMMLLSATGTVGVALALWSCFFSAYMRPKPVVESNDASSIIEGRRRRKWSRISFFSQVRPLTEKRQAPCAEMQLLGLQA